MNQASTANKQRDRFIQLLRELFQLNQPDLDFGLYRIMHAKSAEIEAFLTDDLLAVIAKAFGSSAQAGIDAARVSYEAELATAKEYGAVEPDSLPKVQQARAAYEAARDSAGDDAEIYDHLYRFFERYYDQGDFLSRRYYARETHDRAAPYSVPYDGSEVYLHWANKDQYYIKTSESFNNYSIDISKAAGSDGQNPLFGDAAATAPRKLHFKLVEAEEGEHNNVKAAADKDRFFLLDATPIAWQTGAEGSAELVVRFQYRADDEKTGNTGTWRDKRNAQSVEVILAALQAQARTEGAYASDATAFHLALAQMVNKGAKKAGGKQDTQPLLAKYLYQYTAKNTMDYFIHKDLGGFLKRELDFYIKNEVMRLDDLGTASAPHVTNFEKYLTKLHTLRSIAHKLITFLAQIEDFQKKLWLKKKFVIDTQWLVTLDKVPEAMYAEVAANAAQWAEWQQLGFLIEPSQDLLTANKPGTLEYLQENTTLVLDTRFFDAEFTARLLASIDNLDDATDGVLVHSENFQALNLMRERYREQVKCVYIDPPYNTGDDGFSYKDTYQHSSWSTMLIDRVRLSASMMKNDGFFTCSISDIELPRLLFILTECFGDDSTKIIVVKMSEASGVKMASVNKQGTIPKLKEYLTVSRQGGVSNFAIEKIPKEKWDDEYNNYADNISDADFDRLREILGSSEGVATNEQELDQLAKKIQLVSVSEKISNLSISDPEKKIAWKFENARRILQVVSVTPSLKRIIDEKSDRIDQAVFSIISPTGLGYLVRGKYTSESARPRLQINFADDFLEVHPGDFWQDIKTTSLDNEGGVDFKNGKKPLKLVNRTLKAAGVGNGVVLDFFAGSGTSVESTISLWTKKDRPRPRVIAIEVDSRTFLYKLLTRTKIAIKNSNASACFKYCVLESYEDTLNNLQLAEAGPRQQATKAHPQLREDYFLNYMLSLETQSSASLLNTAAFADPAAYQLDVKRPGSDAHELRTVDLVETFNWLIGLRVDKLYVPQTYSANFEQEVDVDLPAGSATRLLVKGKLKEVATNADSNVPAWWFRRIEGRVPGAAGSLIEQRVLVLWRKLSGNLERDNAVLDAYLRDVVRLDLANSEDKRQFEVIYVNGSHTLPKLPHCDIRLLEQTFHQRMWESQDV